MNIGIVGSEGSKFTKLGEERARDTIRHIINDPSCTCVVSGHCHLGGVDIFAEDLAKEFERPTLIFPPKELNWTNGYKPRNLSIARSCDICYCISVDVLPDNYNGMRFKECYHCRKAGRNATDHIKSGGCWTVQQAIRAGKKGKWITIPNY